MLSHAGEIEVPVGASPCLVTEPFLSSRQRRRVLHTPRLTVASGWPSVRSLLVQSSAALARDDVLLEWTVRAPSLLHRLLADADATRSTRRPLPIDRLGIHVDPVNVPTRPYVAEMPPASAESVSAIPEALVVCGSRPVPSLPSGLPPSLQGEEGRDTAMAG